MRLCRSPLVDPSPPFSLHACGILVGSEALLVGIRMWARMRGGSLLEAPGGEARRTGCRREMRTHRLSDHVCIYPTDGAHAGSGIALLHYGTENAPLEGEAGDRREKEGTPVE